MIKLNPPTSGHYWFFSIGLLSCLLFFAGADITRLLAYHRTLFLEGEVWRLVTGHLVHSNHWHLILNLASLGMIGLLFGRLLNAVQWAAGFAFSAVFISLSYLLLAPEYTSYVGLSAVLYGVIIVGALLDIKGHPLIAISLILIVTGRVIWQQFDGATEELSALVANRVAIESHLFGLVSGYLYGLIILFINHRHGSSPLAEHSANEEAGSHSQ